MNYEQYSQFKQEIQKKCPECRKHIEALDLLYARIKTPGQIPSPTENGVITNGHKISKRTTLRGVVRKIAKSFERDFNPTEVYQLAMQNGFSSGKIDRVKVGVVLRQLQKKGELKLVSAGNGRIPAVYSNPN